MQSTGTWFGSAVIIEANNSLVLHKNLLNMHRYSLRPQDETVTLQRMTLKQPASLLQSHDTTTYIKNNNKNGRRHVHDLWRVDGFHALPGFIYATRIYCSRFRIYSYVYERTYVRNPIKHQANIKQIQFAPKLEWATDDTIASQIKSRTQIHSIWWRANLLSSWADFLNF